MPAYSGGVDVSCMNPYVFKGGMINNERHAMRAAHILPSYHWNDYNRKQGRFPVVFPNLVEICKWVTCPNILRCKGFLFYNNGSRERRLGMFTVFWEHRLLSIIFLVLLLLSIICQMIIGVIYRNMMRQTDNMSATTNKRLKQCKLKFVNCYQLNGGVANVPVFVDKFLTRLTFLGISLTGLQHLAGQLVLLSVAVAGVGACREIIQGETLGKVLPYYIVSFLALYVYFSISGMVDVQGKKERLKIHLVDYLENHMVNKLRQSAIDWEELTGEQITMIKERLEREKNGQAGSRGQGYADDAVRQESVQQQEHTVRQEVALQDRAGTEDGDEEDAERPGKGKVSAAFSKQEEQELEELLREFFV